MSSNSYHTRLDDHALSFGMVRYSTGNKVDDDHLWKMVVSEYCGNKPLHSIVVKLNDLVQMRAFCDRAIEMLKTDGGRKP